MVARRLFRLFALAAIVAGTLSCANHKEVRPEGEAGPLTKLEFNASRDIALDLTSDRQEDATRVTLGPDGSIIWSQSDNIYVFSESSSATFGCKSVSENGLSAVFGGEISESTAYYALSPAQLGSSCNYAEGKITAELPSVQSAVAGGFDWHAALAISRSDGDRLAFKNAVAIVSFVVRNDGIKSIHLSSSGSDKMTGDAEISWNGGNPAVTVIEGVDGVTLQGDFRKGERYYAVVYPGTYNNLVLEFTGSTGATATYHNTTALVLERNSNVNLFDLEIPADKWSYPSIIASNVISVPAEGVADEITEVLINDGDGWNIAVTCGGCVSSAYWDELEGGVCYAVSANTTTSPRTGTITVTLTKGEFAPVTAVIQVNQEGAPAPPVEEGWVRVTSVSDLVAGDEYVIAYAQGGVVATDISSSVMGYVSASFASDYSKITTLPSSALILTLGGSSGSWTFSNSSGSKLGCTAAKKLAWGSGTTTWTISISGITTPIASTNSSYGTLQYNSQSPRFTTYTSSQQAVTLYHHVGGKVTSVTTSPSVTGVTTTTATISASYYCADAAPSAAGFRYGSSSSSLTATASVTAPSATRGTFSATLSNLNASTTYYYMAYIVENGVTYNGSIQSFTTNPEGGTPSTGGADYGWPELPAQTDLNRDGKDDNNPDLYYSHTFRADASSIRSYSCCYSKSKYHPVWVAAPMHSSYLGNSGRNESWQADPNIHCSQAAKFPGYTRGHMIGSNDRTVTVATNRQTFYYSNIGAQLETGFNQGQGSWNNLEAKVDTYLCQDTLYQVIGCIFDTFTDSLGVTVTPTTTSNGSQVPTAWYKVLLRTKSGNSGKDVRNCSRNELQCIAFVLGHYGNKYQVPSTKNVYTVEQLEAMTGLTFFVNVPNAPKDTYNRTDWGL